ncbi:MAG: TonB-dependent receptor plug domain-containing protein [Bacteroidales bacterium]
MKQWKLVCFLLFLTFYAKGENISTQDSSQVIEEVIITGNMSEQPIKNLGKVSKISTIILENAQTQSLSELLTDNSGIYIKSLGKGAMSTASFRGTSSNHTKVTWNGINLNSPTLGNFDFASIPVFFTDNVTLYHGAGGDNKASGSIGGTVDFTNSSHKINGRSIEVLSEYGSNLTFTEGLSYKDKFGQLAITSRLYYQSSQNNYEYLNKVLTKDPFVERRKNAEYMQTAAMQEFYYTLPKGTLSAIAWWQYDDRNLPPSTIVNATAKENQKTHNLRSLISYNYNTLKVSASYLYGHNAYTRNFATYTADSSISNSNSIQLSGEQSFQIKKLTLGYVANYRYDNVISNNFQNNHAERNAFGTSLFSSYQAFEWLTLEGKGMLEFVGKYVGTTYNLGLKIYPIKDLCIKLANAYNYRVPTLNDLYWTPGGNPNLSPEKGFSYDVSISYATRWNKFYLNADLAYYRMDIDGWIMWIPTGNGYIWEPTNFDKVLSTGVEPSISLSYLNKDWRNKLHFNYCYAYSINNSHRDEVTLGKQIPYVPRNKWSVTNYLNWRSVGFNYSLNFTDVRFTSADETYHTNAYFIHNAALSYKTSFDKWGFDFQLRCENLFNDYYESTQYYPMPLRTFSIGVKVRFM